MNPQPAEIGTFIIVLGVLLAVVSNIVSLFIQARRRPTIEAEFATKAEMADLRRDIDSRLQRMESTSYTQNQRIESLLKEHNDNGEVRIVRIYDRIDEFAKKTESDIRKIGEAVAGIKARCSAFHGSSDHD